MLDTMISSEALTSLAPQAATILNVGRSAGSREIRGAVRYRPGDLLAFDHLALPIDRESTVVLYAEGGPNEQVRAIAERMRDDGFADVRILDGSLRDYEQAGGETQEPSLEQVVPPQAPEQEQALDPRM